MGLFLVYILKSSLCLAAFYLFYRLLLSRETLHRFNRVALLGVLLLAALLPLVEVSTEQPTGVGQTMLTLEEWLALAEAMVAVAPTEPVEPSQAVWPLVLLAVYGVGMLFFLGRNLLSLIRLGQLLRRTRREDIHRYVADAPQVLLLVHEQDIAPFSWMRCIVIARRDLEEDGRPILLHELAHIRRGHSWDLLLADLCCFVQWFNPAAWLLKQELQTVHEYEADEAVLCAGVNAKEYQLLLIKKAVGTRLYSMANSLNHSTLKKRITMMTKEKSSKWACAKFLYVLPLAAVAVAAFARPEVSGVSNQLSSAKVTDLAALVKENKVEKTSVLPLDTMVIVTDTLKLQGNVPNLAQHPLVVVDGKPMEWDVFSKEITPDRIESITVLKDEQAAAYGTRGQKNGVMVIVTKTASAQSGKQEGSQQTVYDMVTQAPAFPGGQQAMKQFIKENMKYPQIAKENGIQGRVILQFVVDETGKVTDPKVLRGIDPSLDTEAIRLVNSMPRWTPGQQDGKAVAVRYTMPVIFSLNEDGTLPQKNSVWMIDGKVVTYEEVKALQPSGIVEMRVWKGEQAKQRFGEQANGDGVIEITTKAAVQTKGEVLSVSAGKMPETSDDLYRHIGILGVGNRKTGAPVSPDSVLILIDGVPASQETFRALSPDKIASISVLKDKLENMAAAKGKKAVIAIATGSGKPSIVVSGTVVDEKGGPILGALVRVVGSVKKGVVTDGQGNFTITVPEGCSLEVSYIDHQTTVVKAQPELTVTLKAE